MIKNIFIAGLCVSSLFLTNIANAKIKADSDLVFTVGLGANFIHVKKSISNGVSVGLGLGDGSFFVSASNYGNSQFGSYLSVKAGIALNLFALTNSPYINKNTSKLIPYTSIGYGYQAMNGFNFEINANYPYILGLGLGYSF